MMVAFYKGNKDMVKDKAYVCNLCRKVITYSPEQSGTASTCPFCKASISFPSEHRLRPAAAARGSGHRFLWPGLALATAVLGAVLFLLSGPRGGDGKADQPPTARRALMQERITVAPMPVRVRGQHATVAVTDVRYGCPEVYQAALKRTVTTETPVCSVRLAITNTGKEKVGYRPWRVAEALSDQKKAELTKADGTPFSLVSFGLDSYPVGAQMATALAPGETFTDLILFLCDAKPTGDLELVLPCENMDGKGELRFTIPQSMVR